MPDVISDTNGKLCVGSYHMWRLLSNPDNYSLVNCAKCWQTDVFICFWDEYSGRSTISQRGRQP